MTRRHLALLAVALLVPASARAQAAHAHTDSAAAPVALYHAALGSFSWPVSTRSAEAQAYFDQGVKLMYAFTPADARRSFAEARRRDSRCAMCWWGEAWSMGPYLNGAMSPDDAPAAHAAAATAAALATASGVTAVERDLVAAMVQRYAAVHPAGGRKALDSAFATAMAAVHGRHPGQLAVATLYADALMLLEPRRGVWPVSKPSVARIHAVLERVLARDIAQPGACHLYIHATETTPRVTRAERCADLLRMAMPGASHLNHMPSHTYNRVGRWADAVRANIEAVQADGRAAYGDGFAIYPAHNLHMLSYSASVDGQGAVALQAAADLARMLGGTDGASFRAMALVRFGRFREVLELREAPAHPVHRGLWAFALGHAHLRLGRPDSALAYARLVDSLAQHTPDAVMLRQHTARRLLGVVGGILRGELAIAAGRRDEGIAALAGAVEAEDGLNYDEPEPLPFAARDWLGAALLDAGRAADAERVYLAALEDRPHNGWSLFGLERALRAQGRTADADRAGAAFRHAWSRADVLLRASRHE
jgi:tetratricopeptide (TPR) repeat protein